MECEAIVVYAENEPLAGVALPGPHQTYRHPRVALEPRSLSPLAPDALRLEMLYAGVCGTDLHFVQSDPQTGYLLSSSPASVPLTGRIIGHEGIGRVIATGADVRNFSPGAIVALESLLVCHHCDRCRGGRPNQCRSARLLGLEHDGLFATVADIPANAAHDVTALISDESDLQALACLEPAAVAYVACQNARVAPGDRVTIFGAGPIGLYCAMIARTAFGAGEIIVVEPLPLRRQLAQCWADRVFTPKEFFEADTGEIDVLFETSGRTEQVNAVLPRMNAGGRIVLLARTGEPFAITATDHLITNAVSIIGSRGHLGGAYAALLELYRQGRFNPGEIVTQVADGLATLAELLRAPATIAPAQCKVLVKFNRAT